MGFEYDPEKSKLNKNKHGLDFEEAQALWGDVNRLEIKAKTVDEERFAVIGRIGEQCWTGTITYRNETIRIISVRRARKEEVNLYESS